MATRVVAVAVLLVLAGCGSPLVTLESTETVTPASVPDVVTTTDDSDGPLPPGLTGNGVRDPEALARSHLDALENRSYTWHARTTVADNASDQRLAVEAPKRYTYTHSSSGSRINASESESQINTSEFANGDVVFTRYYRYVEQLRRAPAPNATDQYGPIAAGAIERYLAVENATVVETLVNGTVHYRVSAAVDSYDRIEGASNYTVTAVIAPTGFVRGLNASYVYRNGTRRVAVDYQYRYTELGTTTADPPNWYSGDRWATNPTETPD